MIENYETYVTNSFKTLKEACTVSYKVDCLDENKTKVFDTLRTAKNYYNAFSKNPSAAGGYIELLQEKAGETILLDSCGDQSLVEKKKKKKKSTAYIVMNPGFPKINADKFNHAMETGKCPTSGILGGETASDASGCNSAEGSCTAMGEDIEKTSNGKWVNKGKEGTHGEFKTKKAARQQQKAMFANGYTESKIKEDLDKTIINTDNEEEVEQALDIIKTQREEGNVIRVVDPLRDKEGYKLDEEDLQRIDGDKILRCKSCQSRILFEPRALNPSEDDPEIYNVGDPCCVCGKDIGYYLADGEVACVPKDDSDNSDTNITPQETETTVDTSESDKNPLTPTERHLDLDDIENYDEQSLGETLSRKNNHFTVNDLSQTKRDTLIAEGTFDHSQKICINKVLEEIIDQIQKDLMALGLFDTYYSVNSIYRPHQPGDIQFDIEEDVTRVSLVLHYKPRVNIKGHEEQIKQALAKFKTIAEQYTTTLLAKYDAKFAGASIGPDSEGCILIHLTYVLNTSTLPVQVESYELKIQKSTPDELIFEAKNKTIIEGHLKDGVLTFTKK